MRYALEVNNLSFAYDKEPVFASISFGVREGEFVSVIGPNGAGKSTLIKCLNKVISGWSGDIALFGDSVRAMSQRNLAKLVGYVPQSGGGPLPFSVEEFVMMGRYPYLIPFTLIRAEDRTAVTDILRRTRIDHLSDRPMGSLSGGERQIAFIAAALVQGAKMLLLDEPAAFLDYKHQVECAALLMRMHREQGITVIMVTHDVNQAIALSNRVVALKNGHLYFDGDPEELTSNGTLESIYETRFVTYTSKDCDSTVLAPRGED